MNNNRFFRQISRRLVNGFILFHLVAFVCWASPFEMKGRNEFVRWIEPYMLWSGLWQGWDMFSPDPLSINSHLEAIVTLRDGKKTMWTFPRMDKLGYLERYFKERYRKWSLSYVRLDAYSFIWEDTARFVARNYFNASNPPKEVKLIRYWMEIAPPRPGSIYQPKPKAYPHNQSYIFYVYRPQKGDLT